MNILYCNMLLSLCRGIPLRFAWCPDTLRRTRTHRVDVGPMCNRLCDINSITDSIVKANGRFIKRCRGRGNCLLDDSGQEELAAWRAQECVEISSIAIFLSVSFASVLQQFDDVWWCLLHLFPGCSRMFHICVPYVFQGQNWPVLTGASRADPCQAVAAGMTTKHWPQRQRTQGEAAGEPWIMSHEPCRFTRWKETSKKLVLIDIDTLFHDDNLMIIWCTIDVRHKRKTQHHLKYRSMVATLRQSLKAEHSLNGWECMRCQTAKRCEAVHVWRTWLCSSRAFVWHAACALTIRLRFVVAQSSLDHMDPSNAVQSHSKSSA